MSYFTKPKWEVDKPTTSSTTNTPAPKWWGNKIVNCLAKLVMLVWSALTVQPTDSLKGNKK